MKLFWAKIMILVTAFLAFAATPAYAQATRTWVSGVGDDANPCSRTAPCKTFAGAISKTAAGGEINTLDPGGFGAVTITKSITIRSDSVEAGILVAGANGIVINAAASDRIILEGLDFEGLGTGLSGINILQARDVEIRNSSIRNFTIAGVHLTGNQQVRVTVDNVHFSNMPIGVRVALASGKAVARVDDSIFVNMGAAGVTVDGVVNSALINENSFWGGPKALQILNGGTVTSFGTNVFGTTATDAPTTVTPRG
jgi:hypothetical protein